MVPVGRKKRDEVAQTMENLNIFLSNLKDPSQLELLIDDLMPHTTKIDCHFVY